MPSQNTLIWVGAAASAVVAAGAGAFAWTHPGFPWRSAVEPVAASAPAEPKTKIVPSVVPAPAAASAAAPGGKAPNEAAASPQKPAFDVVTVDPSGEAVIAGRAAPNAKVELRDAGKAVAEATADAAGQFVIIPPALAPGDHSLSLAASAEISTTVAVSVPAPEAKVAASSPPPEAKTGAAIAPSSAPATTMLTVAAPPSAVGSLVAIQAVEADAAGGLIAKGSAEPNATVRLYLNQADVADAKTQSDGRWSLTIKHGMTPGGYVMHADVINPGGATVVASANTPFVYPVAPIPAAPVPAAPVPAPSMAPTAASASAEQSSAPSASPADPVIESVQTKLVATGHTLWALSQSYYGDPTRYPAIYEANRAQIHNPNVIFPGQVFVVPKSDSKP
jgi:nucleoid-associated protein YgaU